MILAPRMDGVLLVHAEGRSTRAMVVEAKQRLDRVGARLLGMTLNNVRPKAAAYYTSQYYGSQASLDVTPGVPSRSAPTATRTRPRSGPGHGGGAAAGRGRRGPWWSAGRGTARRCTSRCRR